MTLARLLAASLLLAPFAASAQTLQGEPLDWGAVLSKNGNPEGIFEFFGYEASPIPEFPIAVRVVFAGGDVIEAFPVQRDDARERIVFAAIEYQVAGPPRDTPRYLWREVATGRLEFVGSEIDAEAEVMPIDYARFFEGPRENRIRVQSVQWYRMLFANKSRGATPDSGVSEPIEGPRGVTGRYDVRGVEGRTGVLVLRQNAGRATGDLTLDDGRRIAIDGTVQAAQVRGRWSNDGEQGDFVFAIESSGAISGTWRSLYSVDYVIGQRDVNAER